MLKKKTDHLRQSVVWGLLMTQKCPSCFLKSLSKVFVGSLVAWITLHNTILNNNVLVGNDLIH